MSKGTNKEDVDNLADQMVGSLTVTTPSSTATSSHSHPVVRAPPFRESQSDQTSSLGVALTGALTSQSTSASTPRSSGSAPDVQPELPPRNVAMDAFHHYKDQLMTFPRSELPQTLKVEGERFRIIYAALCHHPHAKEKIGVGVTEIFVRRSLAKVSGGKSKPSRAKGPRDEVCCCYVKRSDGSVDDFSLLKCFGKRSWKDDGRHFDASTNSLLERDYD